MSEVCHLDFETRSACNLKDRGLHNYAADPSTEIILACYAFNDEKVEVWWATDPLPARIVAHLLAKGEVVAQNAAFEIAIINGVGPRYGFPSVSPTQFRCTAAQSFAMAMPGSLAKAAPAYGIDQLKDMKGRRLMMKMCQPIPGTEADPKYHESPEEMQGLAEYAAQDVTVERELDSRQMKLSEKEKLIWNLDQKINDRGIQVDVESAVCAMKVVASEKVRLDSLMQKITGNAVATCTATGQLTDWIKSRGVATEGVAKSDIIELLSDAALPKDVREAVALRQEAAKSSTAKLKAMLLGAGSDGRVRGTLQYHGAGTGRWAGRRIQVQNFPRGRWDKKQTEHIFEILNGGNASDELGLFYGSPLQTISEVLRGFIVAKPGHRLLWCDFASIEARVLCWLAGEESVLKLFREGGDVYIHAAAKIYSIERHKVSKAQRQIGKVAVLALGYQGGKGAFLQMAKAYGVKVREDEADRIKENWRAQHPSIVKYWHNLNEQAMSAVRNPGEKFSYGAPGRQVTYVKKGSFLWCKLPSGRVICYPYPKIKESETSWGELRPGLVYMGESSFSHKWEDQRAYGGLLCENITQAVARDILAESLIRVEGSGYPVVMHVHDEVVCEVPFGWGSVGEMEQIVSQVPSWANGLPISAEGNEGVRYSK